MRFFSFESALSPEEIQHRCLYLLETEEHSPWNIFKEYTSARRGLHLYQTDEDFVGYFESGERNRQHSLQRIKIWIKVKIKEKNGKVTVKGYTYSNPIILLAILSGAISMIFAKDFLALGLLLAIAFIFLFSNLKDEDNAITDIENRIAK